MGKEIVSLKEQYGIEYSQRILESWKDNIEAVKASVDDFSEDKAIKLARMLENTRYNLNRAAHLFEATQPTDIGPFKKYAFDIITAVMPNLIAEEIVSVQPLSQKTGQVFLLKYLYGSTKGDITKGDEMLTPYVVSPVGYTNRLYSSEDIENESIGNAGATTYNGNLAYIPIRPGTIVIDFGGGVIAADNGLGVFTGGGVTSGTIDYASGSYEIVLDGAAASDVLAAYSFNLEQVPSTIPQVDVKVEEYLISARPRKLRALYAFDAAYDLKIAQGIDLDTSLLEAVSTEIKHEIDGEIMNDLLAQAGLASSWDMTNASPGELPLIDHYRSFLIEIASASGAIFQATRRNKANFIILGKNASTVLDSIGAPRFVSAGVKSAAGPHLSGTLDNKYKVFCNPYYGEDDYLVGYKGDLWLDAGYVYAPYLPIFTTSLLMMDDFVGRRGFATSYGKRMNNNKVYVAGTITHSEPS